MEPRRDACPSRSPAVSSRLSVRSRKRGWSKCSHNILAPRLSFTAKTVPDSNPLQNYLYLSDVRRNLRDDFWWARINNQHSTLLHLPSGIELVSDRTGGNAWRYRGSSSNSCRQGHVATHDRADSIRKGLTHEHGS